LITDKGPCAAIKPVQPTAKGPDPQKSPPVLDHGADRTITQAVGIVSLMPVDFKIIPVISIQAILRTDPQKSFAALEYILHRTLGEALFH
jgi:hypothetical protein